MTEERSLHDEAIDILKERLSDAATLLKERYKGVRPFRQQKVSNSERIDNYIRLDPEKKEFYRQQFGEAFDLYEQDIYKLMQGRLEEDA